MAVVTSGDRLSREALIDAARRAAHASWHVDEGPLTDAQWERLRDKSYSIDRYAILAVDAVLPLIADAIEAQDRLPYAMQRYVRLGDAALVRSLIPAETEEV